MTSRGSDGLFHPATEAEVAALIQLARADGRVLRVHGARHSEPMVVGTEAYQAGRASEGFDLRLDRMTAISIDRDAQQVTVGAGCRFGADPREPELDTGWDRSLNAALDAAGLALPNLGGVSHQTIGGFLMTGSAGGSVRWSLGDAILSLRLVDGAGVIHEFTRGDPRFFAAGVSLGVLGVVTSVRFACMPRYDVVGSERVHRGTELPFDRRADGAAGLEGFLRREEYARLLWWPQPGVDKWVLWTGKRAPVNDAARKPYEAFPSVFGSSIIPQAAAGFALDAIGRRKWWTRGQVRTKLFNLFVPLDDKPRAFREPWHRALPMDDQIDETLLPTRFTEIWLPLERSGEVLRRLTAAYRDRRAAGTFALEIYAAGKSDFWLSPGYGRDSLRLNFFWFDKNPGNPARSYFPRFWKLFADLEPRFHWGKLMPEPNDAAAVAMRQSFPRFTEFLFERRRFDPGDVLLSGPWRSRLGLGGPPEPAVLPPFVDTLRKPLWFPLEDRGLTIARGVPKIRAETVIACPAEEVYDLIEQLFDSAQFVPGFRGIDVMNPDVPGEGRRFRETLAFLTLDMRVLTAQRGRRWAAAISGTSVPLAKEMAQVIDFTSLTPPLTGPPRTKVDWQIYFESLPSVGWAEPAVTPGFSLWLRALLWRLKRFAESRHRSRPSHR